MEMSRLKERIQRLIRDGTRHYGRADYLDFLDWLEEEAKVREQALHDDELAQLEEHL